MGAKYLPTVRDQKASLRFLKTQKPAPNFKNSSHDLKEPVAPAPLPPAAPVPVATPAPAVKATAKAKTAKRK